VRRDFDNESAGRREVWLLYIRIATVDQQPYSPPTRRKRSKAMASRRPRFGLQLEQAFVLPFLGQVGGRIITTAYGSGSDCFHRGSVKKVSTWRNAVNIVPRESIC
jgi:hypothetical protein